MHAIKDASEVKPSDSVPSPPATAEVREREVRFEHSRNFTDVLQRVGATLLISTYQAGKVVAVGTADGRLRQSFHNFDRPMGMAVKKDEIAVAARNQVWCLRNTPDVAARMEPAGTYRSCFLTRSSRVTGEIQAHEMGWSGDELWVVNTLFSCLCTPDSHYSFVPRWCPSFITSLAAEDRCHLNGLAMDGGKPKYVTAMSQTDTAAGWRPNKVSTGCLIEVETDQVVAEGFAMPHSPRCHDGNVWLLESGRGRLVRVDTQTGDCQTVVELPGYTRGLAFYKNLAFVGLSRIRETSTFGGVPIAENREGLKCGVGIVDIRAGKTLATFEFKSGVEEIFDIALVPDSSMTAIRGPFATSEGDSTIWTVPQEARSLTEKDVADQ